MQRLASLSQRMHHLRQTVGPQPRWVERLKFLPASCTVSPNFKTSRVPVVAQQVRCPFGSVELESRSTVALNAMTGDER